MGKRRGVSRRGLLGVFGRGLREFRAAIDEADGGKRPPAAENVEPQPHPEYDRLLRPAEEMAFAEPDGPSAWIIQLGEPLAVGASVVVSGDELPEHLILVRVHATHFAAASSECPVDGSDLIWRAQMDCLACPSCGSTWRLDGEVLAGPADTPIARFVVDVADSTVRITSLSTLRGGHD